MDISAVVDEHMEQEDVDRFCKVYDEQLKKGVQPSAVATFTCAHALIKSSKESTRRGIFLLEALLKREQDEDVPKRDSVYYLAVGHTRLKEYDRALEYVNLLLGAESDNRQALELKALIEKRMKRDGLMGLAVLGIGGGVALAAGIIAAGALRRK